MSQISLPREVERAMYGSQRLCAVCNAPAHISTQVRPGMPMLGWCDLHEPEAGWDAADGFAALRDGTMTVQGRATGKTWTPTPRCEECGVHFTSTCASCLQRDGETL